ncbi:MAG: hypothetical protein H6949_03425 [Zoogloeaceae bacterium]|nr:hypothetical protein [Zoogloeaceae bacterium]
MTRAIIVIFIATLLGGCVVLPWTIATGTVTDIDTTPTVTAIAMTVTGIGVATSGRLRKGRRHRR